MAVNENRHEAAPLNELIGDTLRHAVDLVNSEMELLRAEVSANVRRIASGLALMVFAAVFLIIALGLAVDALVAWLTPILGSQATAAIVCALGAAAIAAVLLTVGLYRVRVKTLYPKRTVASVRRDADMLKQRVIE